MDEDDRGSYIANQSQSTTNLTEMCDICDVCDKSFTNFDTFKSHICEVREESIVGNFNEESNGKVSCFLAFSKKKYSY